MTADSRRKLTMLAGLVAVLAAVLAWQMRGPALITTAAPPASRTPDATAASSSQAMPPSDAGLRLERLEARRGEVAMGGRDPFRFVERPVARPVRVETVAPSAPATPVRTGPPPPPPIPLKFIGVLNAASLGGQVAILSDARGNVFHGRAGDLVEGRYRVVSIGEESAELSYADGRGRQTIRLSGQ